MRIGIDARYLSHGLVGGVHTYVRHLVPALLEQADAHDLFLYADAKSQFELADLPACVTLRTLPYRNGVSSVQNDLWTLRARMARDCLDVAHFPANYGFGPPGARTVITLHDEINIMPWWEIVRGHPKDVRTLAMMTYLHACSTSAVRRADLLITVSEYARQQIARYSGFPLDRIVAIHHAPTPDLRAVTDADALAEVRARLQVPERFVLADGIKNPGVLVRAWRRLPETLRAGRQIVFFSRRPDPPAVVQAAAAAGQARLLIRPSRADLIALYSQAEAFVFPSWIEGFGIPILEAMTCGAPVIASDRGAIPEVADGAALIIDAEDEAALAACLAHVLTDPSERERLRALGRARAAQFSWAQTARRVLDSYPLSLPKTN
jgi:glycosyltransferase involved in cell wall biosynthesis